MSSQALCCFGLTHSCLHLKAMTLVVIMVIFTDASPKPTISSGVVHYRFGGHYDRYHYWGWVIASI